MHSLKLLQNNGKNVERAFIEAAKQLYLKNSNDQDNEDLSTSIKKNGDSTTATASTEKPKQSNTIKITTEKHTGSADESQRKNRKRKWC